ncbi:MAG TPA: fatty acid desaturase [Candidatus Udaeobacter sp.]
MSTHTAIASNIDHAAQQPSGKSYHFAAVVQASSHESDPSNWSAAIARFKRSDRLKSMWQLCNSLLPFCGLWYLMYLSLSWSYWITLVLAVPTAGLLVRLFIIQHDCGHHSFFRSRRANDAVGSFFGLFTLTPYRLWLRSHSRHHASSGDLHHRGHGDVWILTVDEYLKRSFLGRLQYRIYRHPLFLFGVGPSLLFLFRQRFTFGVPTTWRRERSSVHITNLGILAALVAAWCTIGLATFLLVHLPILVLAASIGSWLFFVQHQFEHAYWQPHDRWDYVRSAFEGSSYYRLPRVLQWFTGNIGFHHIHHLESRIPNYNLPLCYAAVPEFRQAVTLGMWESLKCTRFKLWDEQLQRMVTFNEVNSGRT